MLPPLWNMALSRSSAAISCATRPPSEAGPAVAAAAGSAEAGDTASDAAGAAAASAPLDDEPARNWLSCTLGDTTEGCGLTVSWVGTDAGWLVPEVAVVVRSTVETLALLLAKRLAPRALGKTGWKGVPTHKGLARIALDDMLFIVSAINGCLRAVKACR